MSEVEPTFDRKYDCIICKQPFTTKKLRSRFIKVISYDTDYCPNYSSEETNPFLYHINVCPHCGYSSSNDFTPYFPPGAIDEIMMKVCNNWMPHDFGQKRNLADAIKTLKLAAYCGNLKKEKQITMAGIYVRIAWIYRSLQNEEQELRFLNLATKAYLDSYLNDDYRGTQVSDTKILYLIGELSRRTNQTGQAVKFLSKVIKKQGSSTETGIIEMARERWYEVREAQKADIQVQEI